MHDARWLERDTHYGKCLERDTHYGKCLDGTYGALCLGSKHERMANGEVRRSARGAADGVDECCSSFVNGRT